MTFLWPEMLWLLVLLPLLVALYIWIQRRRKRTALRFANLPLVRQAVGKSMGWRRHVAPALLLVALGVLIVAVARPVAVVTLPNSRATVILVMDTSGSMGASDVKPSRIAAAQEAAKTFIAKQPPDVAVGIVAFAAAALLVQAPTLDRDLLTTAIDSFDLRRGTAVGAGLITALETIFPDDDFNLPGMTDPRFNIGTPAGRAVPGMNGRSLDDTKAQDKPPHVPVRPGSYENAVVVLLTDGATTTGPDPILAGHLAADYGVRVYTVGFGSTNGSVVDFGGRSMRAMVDVESLKNIADTTLGEYFEAQSAEALTKVYDSLSAKLVSEKKLTEIAFVFAGIGALIAAAAAGLSLLWFGRIA